MRYIAYVAGALVLGYVLYLGLTVLVRRLYLGSRPGPDPRDYKDKE